MSGRLLAAQRLIEWFRLGTDCAAHALHTCRTDGAVVWRIGHVANQSGCDSGRSWCDTLADQHVHSNGRPHQVDSERRRYHRRDTLATQRIWHHWSDRRDPYWEVAGTIRSVRPWRTDERQACRYRLPGQSGQDLQTPSHFDRSNRRQARARHVPHGASLSDADLPRLQAAAIRYPLLSAGAERNRA